MHRFCRNGIIFTSEAVSDFFTPGAQYSITAVGGLSGDPNPATQRLTFQWRPTSFTVVNSADFTVPCRAMLREISVTRAKLSITFCVAAPACSLAPCAAAADSSYFGLNPAFA